jgi:hypothetical protein
VPDFLTRKLGPLPTWGWAAIAVGGFVVYRYLKNRQAASTSATPTSAQYSSTVPTNWSEPTATLSTPSGFSYSGPLSGLQTLIPTGALSSTNGSTSGDTNPPGTAATPPPNTSPGLPAVNAANYPQQVRYGQYGPSDYTRIGTVSGGQYTGQQVSGGVPVYAGLFGGFQQGFNMATLPSGTDLYIPSQFTAYEHA